MLGKYSAKIGTSPIRAGLMPAPVRNMWNPTRIVLILWTARRRESARKRQKNSAGSLNTALPVKTSSGTCCTAGCRRLIKETGPCYKDRALSSFFVIFALSPGPKPISSYIALASSQGSTSTDSFRYSRMSAMPSPV